MRLASWQFSLDCLPALLEELDLAKEYICLQMKDMYGMPISLLASQRRSAATERTDPNCSTTSPSTHIVVDWIAEPPLETDHHFAWEERGERGLGIASNVPPAVFNVLREDITDVPLEVAAMHKGLICVYILCGHRIGVRTSSNSHGVFASAAHV